MTETPIDPAELHSGLLERYRRLRDPAALGALFDATAPELFAVALTLAPDAPSAEDALQETFLTLMGAADRHDAARPVLPWLVGILRRKVLEVRRRTGRGADPRRLAPPPVPSGPVASAERRELSERVRDALESLPEPYREVALLRWRYGLEPAEIAHARGVPPGTIRSLLHRTVLRLRGRRPSLSSLAAGVPLARGLEAVRAALLAKASVGAAGGLALAAKLLIGAVALVALVLGTRAVLTSPPEEAGPGPDPRGPVAPRVVVEDAEVARADVLAAPAASGRAGLLGRCVAEGSREPLAGVRIEAVGGGRTTTGPDGRFVLLDLPPDRGFSLVADGDDRGSARTAVVALPPGTVWELWDLILAPSRDLTVRVLAIDGRPIAGAHVEAYARTIRPRWMAVSGAVPVLEPVDSTPAAIAVANDAGWATLTGFTSSGVVIVAEADGFARSRPTRPGESGITIVLEPAAALEARVIDAVGRPVAGAEVRVWRVDEAPVHRPGPAGHSGTSDASGRVRFEALPGRGLRIAARRPGGVLVGELAVNPEVQGTVRLRLPGVGEIRGRAVEVGTGAPGRGARLDLAIGDAGSPAARWIAVRTGEDGGFRVVVPGGARVLIGAFRDPTWSVPSRQIEIVVAAEPGRTVETEVPLVRLATIEGVVRGPGGGVVPGAEVVAEGTDRRVGSGFSAVFGTGRSDGRGRYRLAGIPPGRVFVHARTGELSGLGAWGSLDAREGGLVLGPGETARHDLRLEAGFAVIGRVVGPDGLPVPDASVEARNRRFLWMAQPLVHAGADGRFRAAGIPIEGPPLVLWAYAPGLTGHSEPIPPSSGGTVADVVIRVRGVPAPSRVTGRVRTERGGVPSNVRVYAWGPEGSWIPFVPPGPSVPVVADGSFAIDGVRAGARAFAAWAPGWWPGYARIEVAAGEPVEDLELVLLSGPHLRGTVLDADGAPAAGLPVIVFEDESGSSRPGSLPAPAAVTGADGGFRIGPIPDVRLALGVRRRSGRVELFRDVRAGPEPQRFELVRLVTVRGRVRTLDGESAVGVPVRWLVARGTSEVATLVRTGGDGAFEIAGVPDVAFRLDVGSTTYEAPWSDFAAVRTGPHPGGTTDIDLPVKRGRRVRGRVVDERGAEVAAATVVATESRPGAGVWRTFSRADGTFELRGVGKSPVRVSAQAGQATGSATAGGPEIVIVVRARKSDDRPQIEGRVVDAAGRAVAGAHVTLRCDGSFSGGRTRPDGTFTRPGWTGKAAVLEARVPGVGAARLEGVRSGGDPIVLQLGSLAPSRIRGWVVGEDGRPPVGVVVRALRSPVSVFDFPFGAIGAGRPDPLDAAEAVPDASGEFVFPDLLPGEWLLVAGIPWSEGPVPETAVIRDADDDAPVELRVSRGWTLRARLVGPGGGSRARVEVTVRPRRLPDHPHALPGDRRIRTDPDGRIRLPGLNRGPVEVFHRDEGLRTHRFEVPEQGPGDPEAELRTDG